MENKLFQILIFTLIGSTLIANAITNKRLLLYSKNQNNISLKNNCSVKSGGGTLFKFQYLKYKRPSNICIKDDIYDFINHKQSINIVYFFKISSYKSIEQLIDFNQLNKKFKKKVFFTNLPIYKKQHKIKKFLKNTKKKIDLFLSIAEKENIKFFNLMSKKLNLKKKLKLPLTIIFVDKKYFTHYEGYIFKEMIKSDINQIIERNP